MVGIDRDDVLVARDRPEVALNAALLVMDWIVAAQARQIGPDGVVLKERGIGEVDLGQRQRIGQTLSLGLCQRIHVVS